LVSMSGRVGIRLTLLALFVCCAADAAAATAVLGKIGTGPDGEG
jgi:hypothetical protein